MNINIKATNLELTPWVKEYIEKKMSSLSKMLKRYEKEGEVLIEFEIKRTTMHHKKGDVFYAEGNIHLPKKFLRVEKSESDIRKAIDKVKDHLKEKVQRYKDLIESSKI